MVASHMVNVRRSTKTISCRWLSSGICVGITPHRVSGILELAQLVQDYRVAEMQIRRGRVHAQLHPQPLARLQLSNKLFLADKILDAAPKQRQLRIRSCPNNK